MVELQKITPRLTNEGIALYAVSYDSLDVLRRFASQSRITYPLLSDEGSQVIRRLGLLNTRAREEHIATMVIHEERYEGVSYPAAFFIDEKGLVIGKRLHDDYRVRETGPAMLAAGFGLDMPTARQKTRKTEAVRVQVALESDRYEPFQMLWGQVNLDIGDGWHIYADPSPAGLVPLEINVAPQPAVIIGDVDLPHPTIRKTAGLDEPVPVYTGLVVGRFSITLATDKARPIQIVGAVEFQACDDQTCLAPTAVPWIKTLLPNE